MNNIKNKLILFSVAGFEPATFRSLHKVFFTTTTVKCSTPELNRENIVIKWVLLYYYIYSLFLFKSKKIKLFKVNYN